MDAQDLDKLIEMRLVPYDEARAEDVLNALIDLALDAERQRAARARAALAREVQELRENA